MKEGTSVPSFSGDGTRVASSTRHTKAERLTQEEKPPHQPNAFKHECEANMTEDFKVFLGAALIAGFIGFAIFVGSYLDSYLYAKSREFGSNWTHQPNPSK